MYCVGLTGNLASGKSTVAAFFASLDVDVINADKIAKDLTMSKQPAFETIVKHFGKSVLMPSGELNRSQLRDIIFSHTNERVWLEKLLHPLIREQIKYKINQSKAPYCLIEIPLLTDRASYPYLNRVLVVQAEPKQQIERFITRDNGSEKDALSILSAQASTEKQLALADDVLINTGTLKELQDKVITLHHNYIDYCTRV